MSRVPVCIGPCVDSLKTGSSQLTQYVCMLKCMLMSLLICCNFELELPLFFCLHDMLVVSDYVFFENSSSNPYLIRRIEELNKVLELVGWVEI